jgi:N-acetylmuramoyl-L-alanine amidase
MRTVALVLLSLALVVPAHARRTVAQKKAKARTQFETAERMREALNGRPERERTRLQYRRVLDAFRAVYYTAPTSAKADDAIVAVAELLAESGRQFHDPAALNNAIKQYEFLRREYPGSPFRAEALFTIAQIYKDDLEDSAQARATFEEFLKHYPRSELVKQARASIREMEEPPARVAKESPAKKGPERRAAGAETAKKKPESQTASGETRAPSPESRVANTEEKKRPEPPVVAAEAAKKSEDISPEPAPAAPPGEENDDRPRVLVTGIRHWSTPDYTRVAIDLGDQVTYHDERIDHPDRIFFDLHHTRLASTLVGKSFDVGDGFLRKIRIAQFQPGETRVVLEVEAASEYSAFLLPNPYRLIVDIHGKRPAQQAAKPAAEPPVQKAESESAPKPVEVAKVEPPREAAAPKPAPPEAAKPAPTEATAAAPEESAAEKAEKKEPKLVTDLPSPKGKSARKKAPEPLSGKEAQPTANGERSLIRALGLKIGRIVVDAGHGGHDTGTIGPGNLLEKDLVLDVSLRLGKLLEKNLGAEVVYTRDDDTFVPLETRTAIANQEQADLFISVHANSSRDPSARGVETYYLNFTTSADALEVAARENAVSDQSIHQLQDLVKKIALKEKIEESREFAADVQQSLYSSLAPRGARNRGVKKAPFIVLIGANMPSILAEISFVSNPTDAKRLKTAAYRQKIAEALYRGVAKYVSGLSGVKLASQATRPEEADHSR